MLHSILRLIFQFASWGSGFTRFGLVVTAMYASIKWAPSEQSLLLLLASCTVLPGILTSINFVGFNTMSKMLFDRKYGSDKYRRSVRNSGIFAVLAALVLLYLGYNHIELPIPQFDGFNSQQLTSEELEYFLN